MCIELRSKNTEIHSKETTNCIWLKPSALVQMFIPFIGRLNKVF